MNIQNSIELCAYLTFVLLKKSDHSSGCGGKLVYNIIFVVYNSKPIGKYQKNPHTESSFHAGCRWKMEYS